MARTWLSPRGEADVDGAALHQVGWRLAALTVGLIVALMLVLGVTVYGTMHNVLFQSLRATVVQRTDQFLSSVDGPGPQGGGRPQHHNPGPKPGAGPPLRHIPSTIGDVRFVIATTRLQVIPGADPDAPTTLPDPNAARAVLAHHVSSLWSTQQVDRTGPYLIYTLLSRGHTMRLVQAIISEQQYLQGLRELVEVLLGVSAVGLVAAALISGVLARRALRPIQHALRRQRDFVADAAHELRTPLAIQRTAMELGLAAEAVGEQQGAIEQALRQNVHLTRLVDSLSLLARADSGAATLERQPVDLARLAQETAAGIAILAEERGVRLHLDATSGTRVWGDVGRLRQVLLILLDNALKFTPDGGDIVVRVWREGPQARLQVRDNGPGIDRADLPHLFERFYRADRARSGSGTGLGLAIGRWIAEAHGGRIAAANAPQGGALFTVTLPLAMP